MSSADRKFLGDLYPPRFPDASRPGYFRTTWAVRTKTPLPNSAAADLEASIRETCDELRRSYRESTTPPSDQAIENAMPRASLTMIDETHALVHIVVPGEENRLGDSDVAGIYGTIQRLLTRWSLEDLQGVPLSQWKFIAMLQHQGGG